MSMRQKMAGLLAAFMLATAIFPSHAAGNVSHDSVSGGNAERLASLSANGLERDWNPEGDLGQVDVTVGAALILEKPVTFTISLTGAGTKAGAGEKQLTLGADNRRESRVRFERLAPGDYTLRGRSGESGGSGIFCQGTEKSGGHPVQTGSIGACRRYIRLPGGRDAGSRKRGDSRKSFESADEQRVRRYADAGKRRGDFGGQSG